MLFDSLGLDMSTAIKMFLKKCLAEKGIPFSLKVEDKGYKSPEWMSALMKLRNDAENSDISNMSLDEINAEISSSRAERAEKKGA